MEPREIYAALRRRLLWVGAAIVVSVLVALSTGWDISSTGIEKRTRVAAVARAEFLVDSERSALADLAQETAPLTTRAEIYAQYMRSNAVRVAIAKRAGLAPGLIAVDTPTTAAEGTQNIPRPGPARATEVRWEGSRYRIAFTAQPELPVVTITGQAPTAAEAIELVHAGVATFAAHIAELDLELEREQAQPRAISRATFPGGPEHTRIVPLGSTVAGIINQRADAAVAVLAFVVALLTSCLAIVGVDALAARQGTRTEGVDADLGVTDVRYDRLARALDDLKALQLRASVTVLDAPGVPPDPVRPGGERPGSAG